jgi:hypothetical protein
MYLLQNYKKQIISAHLLVHKQAQNQCLEEGKAWESP